MTSLSILSGGSITSIDDSPSPLIPSSTLARTKTPIFRNETAECLFLVQGKASDYSFGKRCALKPYSHALREEECPERSFFPHQPKVEGLTDDRATALSRSFQGEPHRGCCGRDLQNPGDAKPTSPSGHYLQDRESGVTMTATQRYPTSNSLSLSFHKSPTSLQAISRLTPPKPRLKP